MRTTSAVLAAAFLVFGAAAAVHQDAESPATSSPTSTAPESASQATVPASTAEVVLPVWMQRTGYRSGHVGKYINGYGTATEETGVPPGWDHWQGLLDPTTYEVCNFFFRSATPAGATEKTWSNPTPKSCS